MPVEDSITGSANFTRTGIFYFFFKKKGVKKLEKEELKKEIDILHEFHQHIDYKQVIRIFDLIVDEIFSLKEKLGVK